MGGVSGGGDSPAVECVNLRTGESASLRSPRSSQGLLPRGDRAGRLFHTPADTLYAPSAQTRTGTETCYFLSVLDTLEWGTPDPHPKLGLRGCRPSHRPEAGAQKYRLTVHPHSCH